MRTTLHNHAFIDSEEKPLISNEDFKNLIIATRKVFELRFKYSLTRFQNFVINDLLDEKALIVKQTTLIYLIIKLQPMTIQRRKDQVDSLIARNRKTPLYIKGFGPNKFRVMDMQHNPIINIDKSIHESLMADKKIYLSGLIYLFY